MPSSDTHRQHPLGSGFTAASTVDDVMAGIDLTGTTAVVTGGHSGLGLVTTRALAGAGASVVVGLVGGGPGRPMRMVTVVFGATCSPAAGV